MSVVAKLPTQVLGLATNDQLTPFTLMTSVPNVPNATHQWLVLSPSFLAQLAIGTPINVYIAATPADISAIEAAISAVQIDGPV